MVSRPSMIRNIYSMISSFDNRYQILFLENRYNVRYLSALIITLMGLNIWFNTVLDDLLLTMFVVPIILFGYNGYDILFSRIDLSMTDLTTLYKRSERIDPHSPLKRYGRLKQGSIALISIIILVTSVIVIPFTVVERVLIIVFILPLFIVLLIVITFEILINRFRSIAGLVSFFEERIMKEGRMRNLYAIILGYKMLGIVSTLLSALLILIFVRNMISIEIASFRMISIIALLIMISYYIYSGMENYFRMKEYRYFLKKCIDLKDRIENRKEVDKKTVRTYSDLLNKSEHLKLEI